jgi:hypothetical protein
VRPPSQFISHKSSLPFEFKPHVGRQLAFIGRKAMARIPDIDPTRIDEVARKLFEQQTKKWGAPLLPYPIYAHRPTILSAVRGMWDGLAASGLLDGRLVALVNRRVASHNGCLF